MIATVSYKDVLERVERERRTPGLVHVPEDLVPAARARILELAQAEAASPIEHDGERRNLTRAIEDLYDLRERKIVNAAIAHARAPTGVTVPRALSPGERELYLGLVRELAAARNRSDGGPR